MNTALEQEIKSNYSNTMSYADYRALLEKLHAENKTTGDTQTETYVNFSILNGKRMNRLQKTVKLTEEMQDFLGKMTAPLTLLVITEGWCGDAAQATPILDKMATAQPLISLKLILRDDNPALMDNYLTNGGKSIPKVIGIVNDEKEIFSWGPRPAPVQKMVIDNKNAAEPKPYEEIAAASQLWYAKDKAVTFQNELLALMGN